VAAFGGLKKFKMVAIPMVTKVQKMLNSLQTVLSHQDGCHSAVALLLKAALIQVSDYRLLGASGLFPLQLRQCLSYRFRFFWLISFH
jgi:hypothetical protein